MLRIHGKGLIRAVAGLALAVGVLTPAIAAEPVVRLSSGFLSKHASGSYNENNYGIGIERIEGRWGTHAGYYRNSLDKDSFYVARSYRAIEYGRLSAGIVGGLITGYNSPILPFAAPFVEAQITKRVSVRALGLPPVPNVTPAVIAIQAVIAIN